MRTGVLPAVTCVDGGATLHVVEPVLLIVISSALVHVVALVSPSCNQRQIVHFLVLRELLHLMDIFISIPRIVGKRGNPLR